MAFKEETISSEYIYKGKIINVRRDIVTTASGEAPREIVEHAGGAGMVALKDDGMVIMERQFRKPMDMEVFEIPAGKLDEGEDPLEAAKRELREETGYSASDIRLLTTMYPSVGFSKEVLYIYLCTGLEEGEREMDEDEDIDIEEYHIDELYEMVMAGEIPDAKSQIGILLTRALLDEGAIEIN